jgi:hypothetical protein
MGKERIPVAVCSAVASILSGSHQTLDALFIAAGAPLPIPDLAHHSKWKTWLIQAGNDPSVDNYALLGTLIEEFMDVPPKRSLIPSQHEFEIATEKYSVKRQELIDVLEKNGMRYFCGGRLMPNGSSETTSEGFIGTSQNNPDTPKPSQIEELLLLIVRGLPRAMYPLTHRRKGATP